MESVILVAVFGFGLLVGRAAMARARASRTRCGPLRARECGASGGPDAQPSADLQRALGASASAADLGGFARRPPLWLGAAVMGGGSPHSEVSPGRGVSYVRQARRRLSPLGAAALAPRRGLAEATRRDPCYVELRQP